MDSVNRNELYTIVDVEKQEKGRGRNEDVTIRTEIQ